MERGSDKHGPMVDDEMDREEEPLERSGAESHVESERLKEEEGAPPSEPDAPSDPGHPSDDR